MSLVGQHEASLLAASAELAPRFGAITLIDGALAKRSGFDEAASAKSFTELPVRDRAFARALALVALRHLGAIDVVLAPRLSKPPPPRVVSILRLGVAQVLYLGTPSFAAVTTSVEIAKAHPSTRPFAGLVNAVLREIVRSPPGDVPLEAFAPSWLAARWGAAFGETALQDILACIASEPPTDLTLRHGEDAAALALEIEGEILPGGSLRTRRRGDLAAWPGYEAGRWWVQDVAAAVPARLLAPRAGTDVLDLCAAPGGKTLQLAATGASVTAVDRSGARLRRLSENLARVGLTADLVTADAALWDDQRTFDGVLLDAPCTATGTFRRHPEVLWGARPGDVVGLSRAQSALLAATADRVRKGGRLVYCVCSLEPEEGEAQAQEFVRRRDDFVLDPVGEAEAEAVGAGARAVRPEGWLRMTPSLSEPSGGADGFFIARFRRG
jgi:16S rRNA (cytosine967-C5)-methyltransferase